MEQNDEDLILAFQNGDNQAIEILFDRYKGPILNFALRILSNRADAEDAAADVFVSLFAKKYTPCSNAKFSTWLYTVARNACITRIRKRKKMVSIWFNKDGDSQTYEPWDIPDSQATPSEHLMANETTVQIRQAISGLPLHQKEALILREYQKLSYDEISCILNCSLENVKILIFRAREQLRTKLASILMEGHNG